MKKALLILFSVILLLYACIFSVIPAAASGDIDNGSASVDAPFDYDAFLAEEAARMNALLAEGVLIPIDEEHFPDENFREYLRRFDMFDGGSFDASELSMIWSIDCSGMDIASLQGIEIFTSLLSLDCSNNRLTSLDVSFLPELGTLNCMGNLLTELDVSRNQSLGYLYCSGNELTSLDVSRNPELTSLACMDNRLTELDVSQNPKLTYLYCGGNELNELDVSQNPMLYDLYCGDNFLTELDISGNIHLNVLDCSENRLTSLDVTQNYNLQQLACIDNELIGLDVSNNMYLSMLECERNRLRFLDISGCWLAEAVKTGKQAADGEAKLFYLEAVPATGEVWEDYFPQDPNLDIPSNQEKTVDGTPVTMLLSCDGSVTVTAGDIVIPGMISASGEASAGQ